MNVLKTILYFSIFRYPLKLEEIHDYTNHDNKANTAEELDLLIQKGILFMVDEFYVYGNDLDSVTKRLKGNLYASNIMTKAYKRAKFISKFPYVEAVGISGSLSKGYHDENSDIDFFVITKPDRLWMCRTLLILFKKIFLLNSRKYFCVNYFISTSSLEIEEKNRFTATELKTLIPITGKEVFEIFYTKNLWVNDYFPKFKPDLSPIGNQNKPFFTKTLEFGLNNTLGEFVDSGFKKITIAKWKSKFKNIATEDFKIALKSTQDISKHHPSNFQQRVILALNEKYREFQKNYNIELAEEHA
ncbi:nucleotidyltransferase [Flavobacterium cheongpyeongense]|uniref:Nucleotidyltransferase n=1 Tax=Flavobacterium cheongpyeongense TaxID=2212651 RepID=A0A2V4BJF7_9FLAO|nr:nucleotidyltransferase domain-containing protein [Flavobacterium cheongpyeongense]PXY38901.1 nucleotidyltransferase [Flavobacterium cheongpyeongense]